MPFLSLFGRLYYIISPLARILDLFWTLRKELKGEVLVPEVFRACPFLNQPVATAVSQCHLERAVPGG